MRRGMGHGIVGARRKAYLLTRGLVGEVLREGVAALLLGHLGRGLALFVGDFEVTEGPCEFASNGHTVAPSGEDERGIPIPALQIDRCPLCNEVLGFCRLSK